MSALLTIAAAALAGGQVWIVDDDLGPGADFGRIQQAIDAALPGDRVLVRAGSYEAFRLQKPLVLWGDGEDVVRVDHGSQVRALPAESLTVIAGMRLARLSVDGCAGTLLLRDLRITSPYTSFPTGTEGLLRVRASADVRVHGCLVWGSSTTRPGLEIDASRVEIVEGDVRGDDAEDDVAFPIGDPGGHGAVVTGGHLHAAQSWFTGGFGGDQICWPPQGGDGGHGILAIDSSLLVTGLGQPIVRGGDGGWGDLGVGLWDGRSGDGVALEQGSVLRHRGVKFEPGGCAGQILGCGQGIAGPGATPSPRVDPVLLTWSRADGRTGLRVFAEPGAVAAIEIGARPVVGPSPGPVAALVVPERAVALGAVPPYGILELALPDPARPGARFAQAVVTGTAGTVLRSNSVSIARAPAPCPAGPVSSDCDGDGFDDGCEIALGLEADCDGDGVPDACAISAGSPDENGDGVPDDCQVFATLHVDDDAPGDPGPGDPTVGDPLEDGSAEHPFDSLAEALALAQDGDLVVVLPGLFRGVGNRDLDASGKAIRIFGVNGPSQTVVDAESQGRFLSVQTPGSWLSLEGLTVRGTNATALWLAGPTAVVRDCRFRENTSSLWAGAVFSTGSLELAGCRFVGNRGSQGGAVWFTGSATVRDSVFVRNESSQEGGALYGSSSPNALVERCVFDRNSADTGGAISTAFHANGLSRIQSCVFLGNQARLGGALYLRAAARPAGPCLSNSTLAYNTAEEGGGLYVAAYYPFTAFIEGTLFWANAAPRGADVRCGFLLGSPLQPPAVVTGHSHVPGGLSAIDADPEFALFASGPVYDLDPLVAKDGHLAPESPLIDAGQLKPDLPPGSRDLDGQRRVQGERIDVGADEVPELEEQP